MTSFSFSPQEQALFDSLGIDALILFGSQAQGTAGVLSDFDFGVLTAPTARDRDPRRKIYDALYEILSGKTTPFAHIDIVFLDAASLELQKNAATHGRVLYERSPQTTARFREHTMEFYADFTPLRDIFHKAILARIPPFS